MNIQVAGISTISATNACGSFIDIVVHDEFTDVDAIARGFAVNMERCALFQLDMFHFEYRIIAKIEVYILVHDF